MKKEVKIKQILNIGNSYILKCILNEGYLEPSEDETTGEYHDAFIRTKIKDFDIFRDVVPQETSEIIEIVIDILCVENSWVREDFINV